MLHEESRPGHSKFLDSWGVAVNSSAIGQRSLRDPGVRYPLWPPLTTGCPATSDGDVAYPVEVEFDYGAASPRVFESPGWWAALLPPLLAPGLGEGGTPLVELGDGLFVKDESRNPTWSHKDRLNRCTVSAALGAGAEGIVVASSGNHGASAAAYATRAGLRCVVLASAGAPPAVESFLRAYGAVVLTVPAAARWPLARRIVDTFGLHPVSNLTATHTGHPFGPEGYKPIAYEIVADVGPPAAVFVPTGYGELLFGIWKGFDELRRLGVVPAVPRLFSCEPAAGGPLARAMADGADVARVPVAPTDAYAINCAVGGYRGVLALTGSGGEALLVSDAELAGAQRELARCGLWQELSGAAGLAGYRRLSGRRFEGPVVCVATSSGFKDRAAGSTPAGQRVVDPEWGSVRRHLIRAGLRAS
jgi:threonine synthase